MIRMAPFIFYFTLGYSSQLVNFVLNDSTKLTMNYRIEKATMGEAQVPADKYWGAQTERSRNNFKIGPEASMPKEIIYAFAYLKKAAAQANHELGVLAVDKKDLIAKVCDEILTKALDDQFPLVIWQTGSGTQ